MSEMTVKQTFTLRDQHFSIALKWQKQILTETTLCETEGESDLILLFVIILNEVLFNCSYYYLTPEYIRFCLSPFSDFLLLIISSKHVILSNCLASAKYIISILNIKGKLIFPFKELYFYAMVIRCEYSITLSQIKRASWECFKGNCCTAVTIR